MTHRIQYLEGLLHRWNKAVTLYSPIAGSEYIDDPERSLRAIQDANRFAVGLERTICAKMAEQFGAEELAKAIRARAEKARVAA